MARGKQVTTLVAAILVALIALGAFALSFAALGDLAQRAGIPESTAWIWPLIVDGSIVTAMLVIFSWRGASPKLTRWPWATLIFFALVSVVGNGVHTVTVADPNSGISLPFAVFVGAIPPIALLLSSELLVRLTAGKPRTESAPASAAAPPRAAAAQPVAAVTSPSTPATHDRLPVPRSAADTPVSHAAASEPAPKPTASDDTPAEVVPEIPAEPDAQVEWIVQRELAGTDTDKEELFELFERAGHHLSMRTVQRRLAAARERLGAHTSERTPAWARR